MNNKTKIVENTCQFDFFNGYSYNNILLMHQNIRSANSNFDLFVSCICTLNVKPNVIVLTEAWILSDDDASLFSIDGYVRFASSCGFTRAGGVIVFVRLTDGFVCHKINFNIQGADSLALSLQSDNYSFVLLSVYRWHAFSVNTFLDHLHPSLISLPQGDAIIVGDMNININAESTESDRYLEILSSLGFESCIDADTRVTDNTSSCLDHIFFKSCMPRIAKSAVFLSHVTDHRAVCLSVVRGKKLETKPVHTQYKIDYDLLCTKLSCLDWDDVCQSDCTNRAFDIFMNKLSLCIANSKIVVSKNQTLIGKQLVKLKPWMTNGLCSALKVRDKLYKLSKVDLSNNVAKQKYKQFQAKIRRWVASAKYRYYSNIFVHSSNRKNQWKAINELTGCSSKSVEISRLQIDDKIITGDKDIADAFNLHFIQTPKTLALSIAGLSPAQTNTYNDLFDVRINPSSLFFHPIDESEIFHYINVLDLKKSSGNDGISTYLLKNISRYIVPVLCNIFNKSLMYGVFPDQLKVAVVVPIFKSDNPLNVNNYRPISLLSTFSKLLEKLVKKRLMRFLIATKFLFKGQFGFQEGLSTELALYNFLSKIYVDLNKPRGCKVAGLFLDIQKAFDTVDHGILVSKLEAAGIRGTSLHWFETYLTNRSQLVRIRNCHSEMQRISYGVPQGSVLGPVLFLIFINDLFSPKLFGSITSFADDTALSYSSDHVSHLSHMMQSDLNSIALWFAKNRLSLNAKKTAYLNFSPSASFFLDCPLRYHRIDCSSSSCDCNIISQSDHIKYLGVTLDENLSWKRHILVVKRYLCMFLRKFYYLKSLCPQTILRNVYFAFVNSKLEYCLSCWGSAYSTNMLPLVRLQKWFVRLICNVNRFTHSFPLFLNVKILPLSYLFVFKVSSLFYKISGNSGAVLDGCRASLNKYPTRSVQNNIIRLPKCYTTLFQKSVVYLTHRLFNFFPNSVKLSVSYYSFKKSVKTWLFSLEPDFVDSMFCVLV